MRIKTIGITLLAVGATILAAGTAQAQPAQLQDTKTHWTSGDLGFTTDRGAVTLDAGTFAFSADHRAITVARAGQVVATLPTQLQLPGRTLDLDPAIDGTGKTVAFRPSPEAREVLQHISGVDNLIRIAQANAGPAIGGAILGALLLFWLPIVGWIGGAVVGALVALHLVAGPAFDRALGDALSGR